MPCYTQVKMTQKFQAGNYDLLEAALKAKGWEVQRSGSTLWFRENQFHDWVRVENEAAQFTQGDEAIIEKAKRLYAEHVVKTVAKKKGFKYQQAAGSNRVKLSRSY